MKSIILRFFSDIHDIAHALEDLAVTARVATRFQQQTHSIYCTTCKLYVGADCEWKCPGCGKVLFEP